MKIKVIFISAVIICCLFQVSSCKKTDSVKTSNYKIDIGQKVKDFLVATQAPKDGSIAIMASRQPLSLIPQNQQLFNGNISGIFYINKDDTKSTTVTKFAIDGLDVPYSGSATQHVYFVQSNSNNSVYNWMKRMFGKKVKVDLQGSVNYRTNIEDSTFYVPQEMIFNANFLQTFNIDAKNSQTITWTPDTQNPNGMVYIGVVYESYESNKEHPELPDTSFVQAFLEVPDNGTYTITADKLDGLPTNSVVSIAVARGNYEMLVDPVTGLQTLVYAISESNTGSNIKVTR